MIRKAYKTKISEILSIKNHGLSYLLWTRNQMVVLSTVCPIAQFKRKRWTKEASKTWLITHARLHSRNFKPQSRMQLIWTTMESASLLTLINTRLLLCRRIKPVGLKRSKRFQIRCTMAFSTNSVTSLPIQCIYHIKAQTTQAVRFQVTVTTSRRSKICGSGRTEQLNICRAWIKATLEIFNSSRWGMKPNTTRYLHTTDISLRLIALSKTCRCRLMLHWSTLISVSKRRFLIPVDKISALTPFSD